MKFEENLSSQQLIRLSEEIRKSLDLEKLLSSLGTPHLVGSAALDLMVWPDLDLTVVVKKIDICMLYTAGMELAKHKNVRQMTFRNDTGKWNDDPVKYPDGIYWGIDYRDNQYKWKLDIWFVEDESKQPDLRHLTEILPRLTQETREAIINIKKEWINRPEYGNKVTSYSIYIAVLDKGVRTIEDFRKTLSI